MHASTWLRPLAARLNLISERRSRPRPTFHPRVEGLEDRITPSTVQLTDPAIAFVNGPSRLTPVGSTLYFVADDGAQNPQLWRSDGRPGGVARVESGSEPVDLFNHTVQHTAQIGSWFYFFSDN